MEIFCLLLLGRLLATLLGPWDTNSSYKDSMIECYSIVDMKLKKVNTSP